MEETVIPIIEEQLKVEKKVIEKARYTFDKEVTEEDILLEFPLNQEHISIEKKAINQYVETAPPAVRYEGDTMIISVMREEAVIVKKLMLVEELHITRNTSQEMHSSTHTVRKEELIINKIEKLNTGE
ncbi:YsnF/AvaK domain-containing protein [Dyadobacter sp. CY326]|uniref:YsnF/AvaK domain-containing protein n=1 Tax=Dyadobacter sp. CY326 TaxID=2907300 RepID=UPI001F345198|nr:YsnF/AvaK domain-containing protein [Dyadobacter sp. CY326]MCE7064212.1 YsnF/AvaK domain-containing protein [Dyadobacter sp. CY326]